MIIDILKEENCPEWVIDHSIAVCKKAIKLSENFDVDLELVKHGSLLHDIGRSRTNKIEHGIIGSKIAIDHGFDEKIAKIIERHIGAGISKEEAKLLGLPEKDYIPITLEEKIVAHSDNLLNGSDEVDLDFTINKWKSKMNNYQIPVERIKKFHKELVLQFE
ncbi:MAG: TIGR00295 family protein [Methanobrevibacter sp.]|jgi:uncharacterized protein|nr:TIGR00295 family protein [Candidatus Methanovirga meridionalis]